jgi:hypothetical protein
LYLYQGCFREGKTLKIHIISPNLKSEDEDFSPF